jgi:hypothetical protein
MHEVTVGFGRWEYLNMSLSSDEVVNQAAFREMGKDGWELVSVGISGNGAAVAYFKRPLPTVLAKHTPSGMPA